MKLKKIKKPSTNSLKICGLRFEIWNISQEYRLSIDTKKTRYIFKPFKYTGKCEVADFIN